MVYFLRYFRAWRFVVAVVVAACANLTGAAGSAGGANASQPSRYGSQQSVVTISPPPTRLIRPMRWSRSSQMVRRPSGRRYPSGVAVVGFEPGRHFAGVLPSGVTVVASAAGLNALEVTGSARALAALEAQGANDPNVRFVEPLREETEQHQRQDPATYTVDPTTGVPYEWAFNHIGLDRALNVNAGNSQILVGIVDSGWSDLPDLRGKVAGSWYYSSEGTDALDTEGHGTFVASIIAAVNDDGFGLAGFCGACRIVPFKVAHMNTFNVAVAIKKLVDENVRIINLSLGGPPTYVLLDAINYAISKDVLVVASSGNDAASAVSYPAAWLSGDNGKLGYGLSVGASDSTDSRAPFSNWGTRLSLLAPGAQGDCASGIWAALPPIATEFEDGTGCDRIVLDPLNGGRYAYASGTSFSAPEVAGVAALVWSARPDLANYQVADIIEQSATRPSPDWQPETGWGILNAAAALQLATGSSADDFVHVSTATVSRRKATITVRWEATWADGISLPSGTVSCSATLGGKNITTASEFLLPTGVALCRWTVPKWGVNRRLSGTAELEDGNGNSGLGSFDIRIRSLH
jgi:subtilisin family serine protease